MEGIAPLFIENTLQLPLLTLQNVEEDGLGFEVRLTPGSPKGFDHLNVVPTGANADAIAGAITGHCGAKIKVRTINADTQKQHKYALSYVLGQFK